jgi:hypothetical protein
MKIYKAVLICLLLACNEHKPTTCGQVKSADCRTVGGPCTAELIDGRTIQTLKEVVPGETVCKLKDFHFWVEKPLGEE